MFVESVCVVAGVVEMDGLALDCFAHDINGENKCDGGLLRSDLFTRGLAVPLFSFGHGLIDPFCH
jgi:hypothetical protein